VGIQLQNVQIVSNSTK